MNRDVDCSGQRWRSVPRTRGDEPSARSVNSFSSRCSGTRGGETNRQTPEFLLKLGLSPFAKVLDLKTRVRCRGCGREDEPSFDQVAADRVSQWTLAFRLPDKLVLRGGEAY